MNHKHVELLQSKERSVLCERRWAAQHFRQPPASHCLGQKVSRRCDTATCCNCQKFRKVQQWDLNCITSNIKVKIIVAAPQSSLRA